MKLMKSDISTLCSTYETLSIVVDLQKNIIDELFRTLAMHLSADEIDSLSVNDKMKEAALLMRDIECRR